MFDRGIIHIEGSGTVADLRALIRAARKTRKQFMAAIPFANTKATRLAEVCGMRRIRNVPTEEGTLAGVYVSWS